MRYSTRNLAAAGTVAASSVHSSYPASHLVDGDSVRPWIAAAAGAVDTALTVDLADRAGYSSPPGSYEAGVAAVGENRSSGGGSIADEVALTHGGTKALKVLGGAGGVGRHVITYAARPGETWRYSAWLRGDGTGFARLRIYDPLTGKWWVNGAWQTIEGDVAARSLASYAESVGAVTLEGYAAHQTSDVPLEVHVVCADSGQVGYADDVYLWPTWDLASLHGHNWPPRQGIEVSGSADGSAWTVLATGAATRPAAYVLRSTPEIYRHVRVRAVGASPVQLYAGELWVSQSTPVARSFAPQHREREIRARLLQVTVAGRRHVAVYSDQPRRELELTFEVEGPAAGQALRDGLWRATRGGADPLVVVPDDTEGEAYLCRLDEDFAASIDLLRPGTVDSHLYQVEVRLSEEGHPTVG